MDQMVYLNNKIPNLKHQISNKSQISIFNDQNIHHSFIVALCKPWVARDDAIKHIYGRIIGLEF
jgi:hypothetical protein